MGLLADAGLVVGDLLPPAPDNPKGFFENRKVVEINRNLLFDRERDWTCPPPALDHRSVDLGPLKAVAEELHAGGEPWGFKDPRTLFTLTAWAAAVGDCRLVGVHRSTELVARSMAGRNGFSMEQATAIAAAYATRLAESHRRLGFPIVSFDVPRLEFVERTKQVAHALGLGWDEQRLQARYDAGLVHHTSRDAAVNDVDDYLAEAATRPISTIDTFTPSTIVRTWESLPTGGVEHLPMNLGPQEERLRANLLLWSRRRLPEIGDVATLEPRARSTRVHGLTADAMTLGDWSGTPPNHRRWSHVVGGSVLDEIPADDLRNVLVATESRLDRKGVVALAGWMLEGDDLPASHTFLPAGVTARRDEAPYLHHVDVVAAEVLGTGLSIVDVERRGGGRTHILLSNDPTLAVAPRVPALIRRNLEEAQALAERRANELADVSSALDATRGQLAAEREAHTQARRELDRSQSERDRAADEVAELEKRLAGEVAARGQAVTELAQLRERNAGLDAQIAKLESRVSRAERAAAAAKRSYERLVRRRIVRMALALAKPMRPVFRGVRRMRSGTGRQKSVKVAEPTAAVRPVRSREQVVRQIRHHRTSKYASSGPLVSIIVLTRDGAHHLRRLLPALDSTAYRSFEVIVIDNGSSDDTHSVLEQAWTFPLKVIRNDWNASFSDGNNQGAERAAGDFLLFLNNDLEPVTDQWLGALVAAQQSDVAPAAVGALLVYPDRGDPATDLTVQHRGIRFGLRAGAPHAVNLGGDDPADPQLAGIARVPAVTAAALLTARRTFDEVGGFTHGYVYGAEDVDLCLKLRLRGAILVQGDAVLFHHESATQRAMEPDVIRINRMGNWQLFAETWGPTINRSMLKDRLTGGGEWTATAGKKVAITVSQEDPTKGYGDYFTAHELGDAFSARGWIVHYAQRYQDEWYELPEDVDMVISLLDAFDVRTVPPGVFRVAWVRNWVDRWLGQPWFDSFDLVVASSERAADAIAKRSRFQPPVLPLATNPDRFAPGPPSPTFRADFTFTGSNWGRGRQLVPLLDVRPGERFLLFGANWESDPRVGRYWRGLLDYDLIPELYRSVPIVLDDTAEHTIEHGFVNSRVFDAIAAGALVLTNNELGSQELFDGLLPVYHDRASLRRHLDHYLEHADERQRLVDKLRGIVLEHHTYARRAAAFAEHAIAAVDRPKVAVKVGAPRAEQAHEWGDYHFAHSLVRALSTHSIDGEVHLLPEWDAPDHQDVDVVIHLRGLTTYAPKPAQVNIMWLISHPDDVTPEECDKYDLVCVASSTLAEALRGRVRTPVVYLPQATDAMRFGDAEPDETLQTSLLFVGNSRNQRREAVDWSIELGAPLTVYGAGWDGLIPARHVRATYFPNEDLGRLYASAAIVLNDHWPDMREHGIVSNRILDALAAGALVLSDPVAGLDELVGDTVPTFESAAELGRLLETYGTSPEARRTLAARGRKLVLDHHTFDHRAAELAALIAPLLDGRPLDCDGNRFELSAADAMVAEV